MTVYLTGYLTSQLNELGISPDEFRSWFVLWKQAADEWDSAYFGKDGAYVLPEVLGQKYILRHVHIVPHLDAGARDQWYRQYARGGRRTSDRALVYVVDSQDYLLIALLEEPDAHEIAKMTCQKDRELMEGFAVTAEEWLIDGTIVA